MPTGQPTFYYVDPTEEIAGVLRGIKQAKATKVAVVLPKEPRLFRNDVNLRLISAYAREGGKEVALITPDRAVAKVAAAHGLRVYESPDMAWLPEGRVIHTDITEQLSPVNNSEANNATLAHTTLKKSSPRQRMIVLVCALVAAACLLFAFTPRVTVVVTPAIRHLERQMSIPLVSEGTTAAGVVLHTVEADIEASASTPATGHRMEGVTAASGSVMLFNETAREITVPAGTVVATDGGQRFITEAAVRVPPLKAEYFMNVAVGMKAGQAEVGIRTDTLGTSGNVAAGRIKLLPKGPSGVKVVNPEPTRGGTDRQVTYITNADIAAAKKHAVAGLRTQSIKSLQSKAGSDARILTSALKVQENKATAVPVAGAEGSKVSVTVAGYTNAPYVAINDLRKTAATLADTMVPAGYKRVGLPEVELGNEENVASTGEAPRVLPITARIPVGGTVDPAATAQLLIGMTPEQAKEVLVNSGDIGSVTVKGWVRKRLPRWTPWIRVVVSDSIPTVLAAE